MVDLTDMMESAVRAIVMDVVSRQTHDHSNHHNHNANATKDRNGGMMHMNHEGMSAYLFANMKPFFVLFREAKVSTGGGLAAALVVSFVFTVLATMFSSYSKMLEMMSAKNPKRVSGLTFLSTFTFGLRMLLHYIAMLLVMTMNVWVILAVVLGHAVGFIVYNVAFTHATIKEADMDHC